VWTGLADTAVVTKIVDAVNANGWNFAYTTSGTPTTVQDVLNTTVLDWNPERRPAYDLLNLFSDWLSARRDSTVDLPDGTADRGCDWRITPWETFEWGVIDNFFTLDGTTRTQESDFGPLHLEELSDHIINAFYLVGKVRIPVDGDKFTENDSANWTLLNASAKADDSTNKAVGAYSIKLSRTALGTIILAKRLFDNSESIVPAKLGSKLFPPKFDFFIRHNVPFTTKGRLRALWVTSGDVLYGAEEEGETLNFECRDLFWKSVKTQNAGISTTAATAVGILGELVTQSEIWDLWIDGLTISGYIVALAYDQASIDAIGRYESFGINNQVRTPLEHRRDSRGNLRKWRNSIFEGSAQFDQLYTALPGDRLDCTLTDYNQTAKRYRILSIHHHLVPGPVWSRIEMTDHMATLETPKSRPTLREVLEGEGLGFIADAFGDREIKLTDLIGSITVTSDEIAATLS